MHIFNPRACTLEQLQMSHGKATSNEPGWVRFVTGGLGSCTAEVATLPIDTAKVCISPACAPDPRLV